MSSPAAQPLEFAVRTHPGNVRARNEDFALALPIAPAASQSAARGEARPCFLAVVCDGVGGYPCGDVASRLAAEKFAETVREELEKPRHTPNEADCLALLDRAARAAHARLLERSAREPATAGMATTLSAALIVGDQLFTAQIGDSRIYRFRDGRLAQITDDQSPVGELLRAGQLTPDQARAHPRRHVVSQVLGFAPTELQPDCRVERLLSGDVLLLCSDGLPDSLADPVLESILAERGRRSLDRAADALVERALEEGGLDNITLALARARELGR